MRLFQIFSENKIRIRVREEEKTAAKTKMNQFKCFLFLRSSNFNYALKATLEWMVFSFRLPYTQPENKCLLFIKTTSQSKVGEKCKRFGEGIFERQSICEVKEVKGLLGHLWAMPKNRKRRKMAAYGLSWNPQDANRKRDVSSEYSNSSYFFGRKTSMKAQGRVSSSHFSIAGTKNFSAVIKTGQKHQSQHTYKFHLIHGSVAKQFYFSRNESENQ